MNGSFTQGAHDLRVANEHKCFEVDTFCHCPLLGGTALYGTYPRVRATNEASLSPRFTPQRGHDESALP